MSKHIETRNKLKGIADISSFTDLLNKSTISDDDKLLLRLHYLQGKDFRYIGDMLGYSESTIKQRHRRILKKLSKIL
jgi:RNA polymerase sigma factor (sigma-70 family)